MKRISRCLPLFFYSVWLGACGAKPVALNLGQDECTHCKMVVTDARFGAEWITEKGKTYKFDSIECLAAYCRDQHIYDYTAMWVTNYQSADQWLDVSRAYFLKSDNIPSPMGKGLSAYASSAVAEEMKNKYNGRVLTWSETISVIHN